MTRPGQQNSNQKETYVHVRNCMKYTTEFNLLSLTTLKYNQRISNSFKTGLYWMEYILELCREPV